MPGAMHSASGFERIKVVSGFERRRCWSLDEKLKAVEESQLAGMTDPYRPENFVSLQACYFAVLIPVYGHHAG